MSEHVRRWTAHPKQTPPRSRLVGTSLVLSIVAALMLAIADTVRPGDASFPNPFILVLTIGAVSSSPFGREMWLTRRALATFDEFERAALFRATTRAYLALLLGMAALLALLALASWQTWPIPTSPAVWGDWCMAVLGIGIALPVAIAERTVPLPPAGDGEDDRR